jgi:hypothetical protein
MTRDDIIRMALEAGIDAKKDTLCRYEGWEEPMEKFAFLVAAAEREACAKIAFNAKTYLEAAAAIRARGKDD